jgi:hypothetical protein
VPIHESLHRCVSFLPRTEWCLLCSPRINVPHSFVSKQMKSDAHWRAVIWIVCAVQTRLVDRYLAVMGAYVNVSFAKGVNRFRCVCFLLEDCQKLATSCKLRMTLMVETEFVCYSQFCVPPYICRSIFFFLWIHIFPEHRDMFLYLHSSRSKHPSSLTFLWGSHSELDYSLIGDGIELYLISDRTRAGGKS